MLVVPVLVVFVRNFPVSMSFHPQLMLQLCCCQSAWGKLPLFPCFPTVVVLGILQISLLLMLLLMVSAETRSGVPESASCGRLRPRLFSQD